MFLPSGARLRVIAAVMAAALTACGPMLTSRETYLERGDQFTQEGDLTAAILQYRKAIQKDPAYGPAYLQLGRAQRTAGEIQEASFALTKAVELLPNSTEAKAELGDLALSQYMANPRRPPSFYETAVAMADALLANDPQSFDGLRIRGYLAMAEPDPASAAGLFLKANQVDPSRPDVAAALVQSLLAADEGEAAEKHGLELVRKHTSYGPGYDILYQHYREEGRDEEAGNLLRLKVENNEQEPFYRIQLAEFEWSMGRQEEAESIVDSLLSGEPRTAEAFREAADFYARLQRWEKAVEVYQAGLDADLPGGTELEEGLARAYLELGDLAKAKSLLDRVLESNPTDKSVRISRASLLLATGQPSEMEAGTAEFRDLVKAEPNDPALRYSLGRALRDLGRIGEARQEFQQALSLNSGHLGALRELAGIAIADQDAGLALEYAERALAVAPQDPSVRLVRTAAWALQQRYSEVQTELSRLARQFPTLSEVPIQMGLLELDQGRLDGAESRFRELYKPGARDIRALKGLVAVHQAREQNEFALELVEQELLRQPESKYLLELCSTAAELAGQPQRAIEALSKLAERPDAPIETTLRLAGLHQRHGSIEKAASLLEQAQMEAPENALIPALLGSLHEDSGDADGAIASYRNSVKLDPANATVLNNLAYALTEKGADLEEALSLANLAVRQRPGDPSCVDTLGFVYLKQGQLNSALQSFEGAIAKAPNNQRFRLHLGMALLANGDRRRAHKELRLALEADSQGTEAEKIRELVSQIEQAENFR